MEPAESSVAWTYPTAAIETARKARDSAISVLLVFLTPYPEYLAILLITGPFEKGRTLRGSRLFEP